MGLKGPLMPTIHIYLYEGRTTDQKRELATAFTEDVEKIVGSPPSATQVIFHDTSQSDWAYGGVLASDD